MSQQARKEQEGVVVRRLTTGAGAAALGLAWYFTASAASAVPIAFGAQSAVDAQEPSGVEQLDDHVFVRTVHVQAVRAPAGGVAGVAGTAATSRQATGGGTAAARASSSGSTVQPATSAAPVAQPVALPAPAPAPAPAPTPVATTGGSTAK
jgi:peptidoglycan DL-endopeptidase CwlO